MSTLDAFRGDILPHRATAQRAVRFAFRCEACGHEEPGFAEATATVSELTVLGRRRWDVDPEFETQEAARQRALIQARLNINLAACPKCGSTNERGLTAAESAAGTSALPLAVLTGVFGAGVLTWLAIVALTAMGVAGGEALVFFLAWIAASAAAFGPLRRRKIRKFRESLPERRQAILFESTHPEQFQKMLAAGTFTDLAPQIPALPPASTAALPAAPTSPINEAPSPDP